MGTLITLLLFGITVGLIAYYVNPKPSKIGIIGALLLGTVGSQLGGILSNLILHGDVIAMITAMFMLTRVGLMYLGNMNKFTQKRG